MNLMNKISLRWRVTLLTGVLLATCSFAITQFSIYNAGQTYVPAMASYMTIAITPVSESAATAIPAQSLDLVEFTEAEKTELLKDIVPATEITTSFNRSGYLFFVVFTTFGMVAVYLLMGRALKPVGKLSAEISEITAHNLTTTLSQVASKDEISQLTQSFNLMLERLNNAFAQQKRFTTSAAHELKTPLATMKASIQVLNMEETPSIEDYEENNRILGASVDRLSTMVDQLLLLACEGEDGVFQEEVSLLPLIEAVYEEVSPLYEEKEIQWEIQGADATIFANEALLYRAMYNLIENACKYNVVQGRVSVAIAETRGATIVRIGDTGRGIGAEDLPNIFEAFYRADSSRSSEIKGAGLGLSITKSILEGNGGEITVESTLGEGTSFVLTFQKEKVKM